MKRKPRITWFTIFSLTVLVMGKAVASEQQATPLSRALLHKSANTIETLTLPALDLSALRASVAAKSSAPGPLKFAQAYTSSIAPGTAGIWQSVNAEGHAMAIWRYRIESPNSYSLNLGFSQFYMPAGGRLFVYADGYESMIRPFTDKDNDEHGQLWTPLVSGTNITIEINVPEALKDQLKIELTHINQGFLDIDRVEQELSILKSGSCNVDVACPVSAGWEDQVRSVARYTRSGLYLCTGAAINNTSQNGRHYFLTADHCGFNTINDASIVAYWNYQNSSCRTPGSPASGAPGNGSLSTFNTGSYFRASFAGTDMALLEFDDPFPASADVFLAGWNRTSVAPSSAVAIHHPAGQEKRISFENNPTSLSTDGGAPGSGTNYIRVADWDLGTTEGGSSGSPLFDPNKLIVGQLLGGFAACGNNEADWYGRFGRSWTGGGSSSTRLSNWLDPLGNNAQTLNGRNAIPLDQYENDDSVFGAKEILTGQPQKRTIHLPGNNDWVEFNLSQTSGTEIAIVNTPATSSVTMNLRNNISGTPLILSDTGATPRLAGDDLAAGSYLIQVDPSTSNGPTSYTLIFNEVSDDSYEPDDSSGTASPIALGEEQVHSIYERLEEDWVTFTLTEEKDIIIQTLGSVGDTEIWLYDAGIMQLAYDDNGGRNNFSRIIRKLPAGTYFVRVKEASDQVLSAYKLSVTIDDDFLLQMIPAILSSKKKRITN